MKIAPKLNKAIAKTTQRKQMSGQKHHVK